MPILTKMGNSSSAEPRTLVAAAPAKLYVATYVNENQANETRLIVKLDNGAMYFLHEDGVDGRLKRVSKWLQEKIEKHLPIEAPIDIQAEAEEEREIGGPKNG